MCFVPSTLCASVGSEHPSSRPTKGIYGQCTWPSRTRSAIYFCNRCECQVHRWVVAFFRDSISAGSSVQKWGLMNVIQEYGLSTVLFYYPCFRLRNQQKRSLSSKWLIIDRRIYTPIFRTTRTAQASNLSQESDYPAMYLSIHSDCRSR